MGVGACLGRGGVCAPLGSLGYITALIRLFTLELLLLPEAVTPPPPHGLLGVHPLLPGPLESPCYS